MSKVKTKKKSTYRVDEAYCVTCRDKVLILKPKLEIVKNYLGKFRYKMLKGFCSKNHKVCRFVQKDFKL